MARGLAAKYPIRRVLASGNYQLLARRSGLHRSSISRILRGERGGSLYSLAKIAGAAGITLDALCRYLSRAGHPPKPQARRRWRAE